MHITDIALRTSEDVAIVFVSDLHVDSPLFQYTKLKRAIATLKEQHANVVCAAIGDVMDAIYPTDSRRFAPSSQIAAIAASDDYVMARINYAADVLRDVFGDTLCFVSRGNHEDATIKNEGVNPTKEIARLLNVSYGPYCGIIRFLFPMTRAKKAANIIPFVVAYHHGAWGGKYAKGYLGAYPWFSSIEGIHAGVYGHNHMSRQDTITRWRFRTNKRGWEMVTIPIINCGSWVDSTKNIHSPDTLTHYSVQQGHTPQPNTLIVFLPKFRLRDGYWEFSYPYQVYHY